MIDYKLLIANIKDEILDVLIDQLEDIEPDETKEVELYELVYEVIDENIGYDDQQLVDIISQSGNIQNFEEALIDVHRGLTEGVLRVIAGECMKDSIYDQDIFQVLQNKLVNEEVNGKQAKEIIELIKKEQEMTEFINQEKSKENTEDKELPILNDDKCPKCREDGIQICETATELVEYSKSVDKHEYSDGTSYELVTDNEEYIDKDTHSYRLYCFNPRCKFEGEVKLGENIES